MVVKSARSNAPKTKEEMIERGMTPFTKENAAEMGSRGGKVKSPRKRYARRLEVLKEKGLTDETYQRLVDLMEDKESSELDILMYIENTKAKVHSAKDRALITRAMTDWHKIKHGTKESNRNINLNVQILTEEEKDEMIEVLRE